MIQLPLMFTSTPVPPFGKPDPPPRPLIVLLSASNLNSEHGEPLLAHENLRSSPRHRSVSRVRFHPYRRVETHQSSAPSGSSSPSLHPASPGHSPSRGPSRSPSSANSSPLSSPASSLRSLDEEQRSDLMVLADVQPGNSSAGVVSTKIKIKRPKGAGRRNLLEQVDWKEEYLDAMKVGVSQHLKIFTLFTKLLLGACPYTLEGTFRPAVVFQQTATSSAEEIPDRSTLIMHVVL